jgi:hypothetical protein
MNPITLSLLLIFFNCLASDTTNIVAKSDWSKPIKTYRDQTIRGRLLILQGHEPASASELLDTEVYLELENISGGAGTPAEIYFDPNRLQCELLDAHDKSVPQSMFAFSGGCPGSCRIILPYDCLVRFRVSCYGIRSPKKGGLAIQTPGKYWLIKPTDTNDYFLSATFNINPSSWPTNMDLWTLTLPKTKIFTRDNPSSSAAFP